jgi:hypothetical protein
MRRYLNLIIATLAIFMLASFGLKRQFVATQCSESTVNLTGSVADQSNVPECGTDEIISRNPFLQEMLEQRVACSAPELDLDTAEVIIIPVVMHILHLGEAIGEGTNISDEQAQSCIRNLNERFRGDVAAMAEYTDYYGNVAFDEDELALVIDSKIEFCLAARDPQNLPTSGIIRYDCSDLTYESTFSGQPIFESYAEDGVSASAFGSGIPDSYMKQTFNWPIEDYFNFYVVSEIDGNNGGNGIQGYSYVGSTGTGSSGYLTGPVCLYNVTGDVGNLKAGRAMNATWAHEVGHAFSLYHTFTNGSCNPESNPCTQGDQVPDTPPTTSNSGCLPNSCPDALVENYMDYTSENCKTMFTQNQIERMRHELRSDYNYLVTNTTSCQSPNDNDLSITSVTLPQSWCLPTIDFSISVSNFGGSPASGASLYVNGEQIIALPTIPATQSFTVQLTEYEVGSGDFEIEVIWDEDDYQDNNYYYAFMDSNVGVYTQVLLSPDVWSNELDWEITNEFGDIVMSGGNYPFSSQDEIFEEIACLQEGCYTFTITDSNGDGMCAFDFDDDGICDDEGGGYGAFININVNGNLVFELSDPAEIDFGSELTTTFCVTNCPFIECQGDFNNDGIINLIDLLDLLPNIVGQVDDCSEYDFDGNLEIDVQDVIIFLTKYGMDCFTGEIMLDQQPPDWIYDWIQSNGTSGIGDLQGQSNTFEIVESFVYDLNGRLINKTEEELSTGAYLIVRYGRNGEYKTEKIFINR